MHSTVLRAVLLFCVTALPLSALASEASTPALDTVVAEREGVILTLGELDAAVRRLPDEARVGYFDDPDRAARFITALLSSKQVAAQARKEGWDQRPEVTADLELLMTEKLAESFVKGKARSSVDESALLALAREQYENAPQQHVTQQAIDLWHFLVLVKDESAQAEALELAQSIHAEHVAGASAEKLLNRLKKEHEDGIAGSPLLNVDLNRVEPQIAQALSQSLREGAVTEPVLSRHGYHVNRVTRFEPARQLAFEEVKDGLVEALAVEARKREEQAIINAHSGGDVEINQAVVPLFFERYGTYRTFESGAAE